MLMQNEWTVLHWTSSVDTTLDRSWLPRHGEWTPHLRGLHMALVFLQVPGRGPHSQTIHREPACQPVQTLKLAELAGEQNRAHENQFYSNNNAFLRAAMDGHKKRRRPARPSASGNTPQIPDHLGKSIAAAAEPLASEEPPALLEDSK